MNTVESAEKEILSRLYKPDVHEVSLNHSLNRVLAEDVFADRDFPPFNRVAMDGIAIQFESFNGGQRSFLVESVQAAGSTKLSLKNPKNCVEVMTGAVLPEGCDCVIRYEDVEIEGELAEVKLDTLRLRQNIHQQGSDLGAHALILEKFCILRSAEIGILATVGISKVKVLQPPKIAIISTGDELIEVDEIPLPHQIRKSNVLSLEAMLNNLKVSSQLFHLSDNKSLIKSALQQIVKEFDTLLLSGAVSKGKFDFLPEILAELDIEQHFHIVEQRPGKPFWFGSKEGLNVFAFPGNPVSTFVCAHRYLVPWLHAS
ncbi:MAG: molybdopterin molybdotransferase, partial [Bacteroidia bacterium]